MAFCSNCGTNNNNGSKFCSVCGRPLPEASQPVQQAVPQGFQQIPAPPAGFVPVESENPLPKDFTPIQPVYAQPITQPVQKPINRPKSNGFCNAGLAFSIIGLGTLGLTSPIGLILSVIGFFTAKKKNQPGAGKAMFGMISSALIIIGLSFSYALIWNDLKAEFESGDIRNPMDFIEAVDRLSDRNTTEYRSKLNVITDDGWVNTRDDNSYLEFGSGNTFKFYQSIDNVKDNYLSGKYRLYYGTPGMDEVERRYRKYVTKSDINKLISQNRDFGRDNFVLLVLENDGEWKGGKNVRDEKWTTVYYGFYVKGSSNTYYLDLFNAETNERSDFATIKYYKNNLQNKK